VRPHDDPAWLKTFDRYTGHILAGLVLGSILCYAALFLLFLQNQILWVPTGISGHKPYIFGVRAYQVNLAGFAITSGLLVLASLWTARQHPLRFLCLPWVSAALFIVALLLFLAALWLAMAADRAFAW
jgi:hypothetical protein